LRTTGAQTYSWLPAQNLSCSNCSSPEATLANDAKYYVTGTNAEGCTHTDSITVKVQQAFNLQLARYDDTLCIGESTQLKVSGADRYEWSPETGLSNPRSEQPKASPNLTTRYRVIGSDFNNCFLDTLYLPVIVYPYPEVNAGEDRLINPGSTVQLSILFSSDVTSWNWSPSDDLSCNRCPAPVASPLFNKTYRVTVSNPAGCTASDEVAIRLSCDNSNLNLPNAFTPNNDGRNDIIYPKSTGIYSIVSFVIYNRMGEVVFRNGNFMPNVQSAGWNGMFKGIPAAAGTYVYEISCICNNNNALRFRGNITLIR
jgi:gliding motility-associated-like protein